MPNEPAQKKDILKVSMILRVCAKRDEIALTTCVSGTYGSINGGWVGTAFALACKRQRHAV